VLAQVVDATGLPLDEIPLFFTSTGGLLGSVNNFCQGNGTCSRGAPAADCTVDSDCPLLDPDALVTDGNGVVSDVLTLRLFGDPDDVTVTAKGTNLQGSAQVSKIVILGPADPQPFIQPNPTNGQRTGLPFTFDGSGSVIDPQTEAECYDWRIFASKPLFKDNVSGCEVCDTLPDPDNPPDVEYQGCVSDCSTRGPFQSIIGFTIGTEGNPLLDTTMQVLLRVSDDPTIVCNNTTPVDESKFGPNVDNEDYDIDCDTTDPIVTAGSDKSVSLSGDGNGQCDLGTGTCINDPSESCTVNDDCLVVTVGLTAAASDPEDTPPLDYLWDCGSGGVCNSVDCKQQSVSCSYSSTGPRTATVTVVNDCGRLSTDSVLINVTP
jgi:hypothetical protein